MDLDKDRLCIILSPEACPRFQAVFSSKIKYRNLDILKSENTYEKLPVFLESYCSTIQKMDLDNLTAEKWNIIKCHSYPNLTDLSLRFLEPADDEFVLKMTRIFPNLRSLHISALDISGKHIEKWEHLENLYFGECSNVKFENFERIMKKSQLKSIRLSRFSDDISWKSGLAFKNFSNLEEISLHSRELKCILDLLHFTNLKQLTLLDMENMHLILKMAAQIVEHKPDNLVDITVINSNFILRPFFGKTFNNLRKVIYCGGNSTNITEIAQFAPNLREIIIDSCAIRQKDDIKRFFNFPQMEFISVEYCDCEFGDFRLNVDDIVKHRTSPMYFYFYNNYSLSRDEVQLKVQGESPLLKITGERLNQYGTWDTSFRFR